MVSFVLKLTSVPLIEGEESVEWSVFAFFTQEGVPERPSMQMNIPVEEPIYFTNVPADNDTIDYFIVYFGILQRIIRQSILIEDGATYLLDPNERVIRTAQGEIPPAPEEEPPSVWPIAAGIAGICGLGLLLAAVVGSRKR